MYEQILIRYGDLTLKGKNKNMFINKVYSLIQTRMNDLDVVVNKYYDRMFITLNDTPYEEVVKKLDTVSGLGSYSLVATCETNLEDIRKKSVEVIKDVLTKKSTFKVETKRSFKRFEKTSQEISMDIASYVLSNVDNMLSADMHNPEIRLNLEVREQKTYIYTKSFKGMGGFPCGIAGSGLLMISGGIDSPVAGYLMQKQGVEIEAIHFESTPLTSIESGQKVVDLVKKMAQFAPKRRMKLHMIHFSKLHQLLLEKIPESYNITIMRRMMYRIAHSFAMKNKIKVICNGESVGQVASQTLGSMMAVNEVTNLPIIRPLATFDKVDIINIAKKIDTYETSILPFEDCCTIYIPKSPTTNPNLEKCKKYESVYNFAEVVEECVNKATTVIIKHDSDLNLVEKGFIIEEVLKKS